MKRLLPLALFLALATPATASGPLGPIPAMAAAQGRPYYLGSYDATTTAKTNAEVATPFSTSSPFLANKVLLVCNEGSVVVRVLPVSTSTGDVTTTRNAAGFGAPVRAGSCVTLQMASGDNYLAVITASSTADVDVWEMK